MLNLVRFSLLLLLTCSIAVSAIERPPVGQTAPAFTATDAQGVSHNLSDFSGKTVVLEWTNFGCPFVKKHYSQGHMQAHQAQAVKNGVVWLAICSSGVGRQGHFAGADLTAQLTQQKFAGSAYLVDESGDIGKAYGAKTTPYMVIIDAKGVVQYTGAIDSIKSGNPADIPKATNYVKEALTALAAGTPIAQTTTQSYGCSVKYAK